MNEDYTVDWSGFEKLIEHTLAGGVDYAVVMGTTGESPVFTWKEMLEILAFASEKINGRVPIVFGVGGNDTEVVVRKSKDVKSFNLAAVLSVCPYYNKPSQKGILRHFNMIADASEFPVILYNVPSRTAVNMEAETTIELARHPNIHAIKEASVDANQIEMNIMNTPDDFMVLSGDDGNTLLLIELGGKGVISVAANIIPRPFTDMVNHSLNGHFHEAKLINDELAGVYAMLSMEGNPVSLKAGLEAYGICRRTVKPPLYDASDNLVYSWEAYFKN
jgi:4-hydroxy-tetrahydrodipicolinate synthase